MYCEIEGKGLNPVGLSKTVLEEARKTWLCRECKSPRRGWKAIDIVLENWRPPKKPLNTIGGASMCLAQRDFIQNLGREEVERDLYLGRAANEDGEEFSDFISVRGRYEVIVRGSEEPRCWICPACGRNCYYNLGRNKEWFLYPEPPSDAEIIEGRCGSLVVTDKILARIDEKWRRKLYIRKLKVYTTDPPDGFVELRSIYKTA